MKTDPYTKVALSVIALLLFLNLVSGLLATRQATAEQPASLIGKYQISSWASYIGTYGHHTGYYVLDTTTGKVAETHEDVHKLTE
ncbi:MAG: hypothetical protein ACM3MB_09725 [Acidobacteriota bacterium]